MSNLPLQLDAVDWNAVVAAAHAGDIPPHVLYDALQPIRPVRRQLSRRNRRIVSARESDPLNPVHLARQILLLLRFGESGRASSSPGRCRNSSRPSRYLPIFVHWRHIARRNSSARQRGSRDRR